MSETYFLFTAPRWILLFFLLCLKQVSRKPPAAYSVVNGMNYLHEGNKCQLRIGPLTKQASYRRYLSRSVCVNEYIKPRNCLVPIGLSICHAFYKEPSNTGCRLHIQSHRELLPLSHHCSRGARLKVLNYLFMVQIAVNVLCIFAWNRDWNL